MVSFDVPCTIKAAVAQKYLKAHSSHVTGEPIDASELTEDHHWTIGKCEGGRRGGVEAAGDEGREDDENVKFTHTVAIVLT